MSHNSRNSLSDGNSSRIVRLIRFAGLDADIVATLLLRSWSIAAGGATALLIPTLLSPTEQGYYYTFASILAAQIFFELGLNHVLTQLTSHSVAHLSRTSENRIEGDVRWRNAIVSLLKMSFKWNTIMASVLFFSLITGGSWFFYDKGTLPTSQWLLTWIVLVAATAFNLAFSARLAICEGLGEVSQVAQLRLAQSIVGYTLLWIILACDGGLWAAVALPMASAFGTIWWLSRRRLTKSLEVKEEIGPISGGYSYRKDVFPLQWRIAISWVSGYFIYNFLTPVVFAYQGEVSAGQLGLGLTVFSAISMVGFGWMTAKIPTFSAHIARGERTELNALFDRQAIRAISSTAVFITVFFVGVRFVDHVLPKVLDRLPPTPVLLLLSVVTVANVAIFSMATYVRAHKEEPLLPLSMVSALLIGFGVYAMAQVGLTATVAVYAFITVFVSLPWCGYTFARYRRQLI